MAEEAKYSLARVKELPNKQYAAFFISFCENLTSLTPVLTGLDLL